MRTIINIALLSLFVQTSVTSQVNSNTEAKEFNQTIGLNATGLLNNLLNPEGDNAGLPYLLTYDIAFDNLIFRAGIGPKYSSETVVHEGFTDSQKHSDLQLDGRLGAGIRFLNDARWSIAAGVDLMGQYALEKTTDDTGFDKVTDEIQSQSIGGGPFIQVAYKLSSRISIRTEAAVYLRHYKTTHTELFENFPDFNNQLSKTTGTVLDTFLPTSIFVHLHF